MGCGKKMKSGGVVKAPAKPAGKYASGPMPKPKPQEFKATPSSYGKIATQPGVKYAGGGRVSRGMGAAKKGGSFSGCH